MASIFRWPLRESFFQPLCDFAMLRGVFDGGETALGEPVVEVGAADAADLGGDPNVGEAALGPPVADGARRDAADIGGGGFISEDFRGDTFADARRWYYSVFHRKVARVNRREIKGGG